MLYFMITITDRPRLTEFISLYKSKNTEVNFVTLGHGTAGSELLDILGLDSSEKAVCFAVTDGKAWENTKKALERKIRIDIPGTGIVFTVPMSSIAGGRELKFLTDGLDYEREEESVLKNTEHELIVVISDQGHSEIVMDAARSAGAGGGTVIHAKGTGMAKAEKFLGISLASEKDIIFIVCRTENKNAIMTAVMNEAGMNSKAKSIIFSLPVTDTAGLRLTEENE